LYLHCSCIITLLRGRSRHMRLFLSLCRMLVSSQAGPERAYLVLFLCLQRRFRMRVLQNRAPTSRKHAIVFRRAFAWCVARAHKGTRSLLSHWWCGVCFPPFVCFWGVHSHFRWIERSSKTSGFANRHAVVVSGCCTFCVTERPQKGAGAYRLRSCRNK
jgi:hypothetical protein